jgi:IMP dehydrogenase/GMP reductase
MDEVFLFDRVLTAEERAAIYRKGVGTRFGVTPEALSWEGELRWISIERPVLGSVP